MSLYGGRCCKLWLHVKVDFRSGLTPVHLLSVPYQTREASSGRHNLQSPLSFGSFFALCLLQCGRIDRIHIRGTCNPYFGTWLHVDVWPNGHLLPRPTECTARLLNKNDETRGGCLRMWTFCYSCDVAVCALRFCGGLTRREIPWCDHWLQKGFLPTGELQSSLLL